MGEDVCYVIKDFFKYGKMLKVINCFIIILVLKCFILLCIRDFRFIVCCIIIYKLILKVFINRM